MNGSSLILPLLLILAAVGLFFGVIDPTYSKVQALEERNGRLEDALVTANQFRDALVDLRSRYNLVNDQDKARLLRFLPDQIDNVRLIINVDDIAEQHNVIIRNFEIEGEATEIERQTNSGNAATAQTATNQDGQTGGGPLYDEIELSFQAEGAYEDFLAFFADVERNLRVVDTVSVNVTPPGESAEESSDIYKFNLTIKTYWLK